MLESFHTTSKTTLARKYFDGYGPEVFTIASSIPATLRQDASLEKRVWQELSQGTLGVCILGEAGSGKSTFTHKVLFNVTNAKDIPVYLYRENAATFSISLLAMERYLSEINKDFGVVLIDDLHIYSDLLGELYSNNRLRRVRVLTSARKSEWHSRIKRAIGPDIKVLEYNRFESGDIDNLIDQLSAFYPSPAFTKLSREEKVLKL